MGGACGMYAVEEICVDGFVAEALRKGTASKTYDMWLIQKRYIQEQRVE
jgi:hypothetical protein